MLDGLFTQRLTLNYSKPIMIKFKLEILVSWEILGIESEA